MAKKEPLAFVTWTGKFQRDAALVFPLSVIDLEALERLRPGMVLALYEHRPRTDKQNMYMRWLAQVGADNAQGTKRWEPDAIIQQVKIDTGKFDGFIVTYADDGSILSSRHNLMSTADFSVEEMKEFIDRLIDFVLELCPGMSPADLEPKSWEERHGLRKPSRGSANAPSERSERPPWLRDE